MIIDSSTLVGSTTLSGSFDVTGSIIPGITSTFDLGSASKVWRNLYVTSVSGSLTGSNLLAGQVVVAGTGGVLSGSNKFYWDDATAFVGIGTTLPNAALDVNKNNGIPDIRLSHAGTAYMNLYGGNGVGSVSLLAVQAEPLILGTGNAERVRINASGNVGIGTNAYTDKLAVNGSVSITGSALPGTSNTYSLGSSSKLWSTVYATNLTGSLSKLSDGTSYLIAGNNIAITTGSTGAVTITSTGVGGSGTINFIPKFASSTSLEDSVLQQGLGSNWIGNSTPFITSSAYGMLFEQPQMWTLAPTNTQALNINNKIMFGFGASSDSVSVGIGTTSTTGKLLLAIDSSNTTLDPFGNYGMDTLTLWNYNTTNGNSTAIANYTGAPKGINSYIRFINDDTASQAGSITFGTSDGSGTGLKGERMRIDRLGRVGIGTTSITAFGSDVFFVVSGSRSDDNTGTNKTVFRGDVRISGSLAVGTGSVFITSNDIQFGSFFTRVEKNGSDMKFFDTNNPGGKTLTQLSSNNLEYWFSTTSDKIYTTGSVGIGVTNPTSRLFVTASSTASDDAVIFQAGTTGQHILRVKSPDGSIIFNALSNTTNGGKVGVGTAAQIGFHVHDPMNVNSVESWGSIAQFTQYPSAGAANGVGLILAGFSSATSTNRAFFITAAQTGAASLAGLALNAYPTVSNPGPVSVGTLTNFSASFTISGSTDTAVPTTVIKAGIYSPIAPILDVQSNIGTSLLTVSGSNFVGIGTGAQNGIAQGSILHVSSSLTGNANSQLLIGAQLLGSSINLYRGFIQLFQLADGTETVRITNEGNVGIGITNPNGNRLAIAGGDLSVTGSVQPGTSNSYSIGSPTNLWSTIYATNLTGSLTKLSDGTSYLIAGGNISIASGSTGAITISTSGLASSTSAYVTIGSDASLSNERALTAGTGLTLSDGGAGGNVTLGINDSIVATISGSTFTGTVKFNAGLSGSLTQLTDGSSYLVAGSNVSIITGSNGQVTITSSSPSGTVTGTGTTNFLTKWTGASAIGDSVITSVGTEVGITGSLLPGVDNQYNVGSPLKRWNTIYAANISGSFTGSNLLTGQVVVAGTGNVLSGSNLLYWDNATTRLGIGTSNPSYQLTVNGTVGLSNNLVKTTVGTTGATILDVDVSSFAADRVPFSITGHASQAYNLFQIGIAGAGDRFIVDKVGNVSIGASNTNSNKLSVNGVTAITGSVIPGVDDSYNLGSSSKRWSEIWARSGSFSGNLTVSGNFTVLGTQTIVDSTVVNIKDNVILLNAGPSPLSTGGIYVADTIANTTGSLLWDASTDRWKAGLSGDEINLVTTGSSDNLFNKTITISGAALNTISGGTPGGVGYFNTSGFLSSSSTGTSGQILQSAGTGSPTWSNFGSLLSGSSVVTGSGTVNYHAKFSSGNAIANSLVYDDGTYVGVNNTSPSATLHVGNNDSSTLLLNGASKLLFRDSGTYMQELSGLQIESGTGRDIAFRTSNSERVRIDTSGNVGIGTSTYGSRLYVSGSTSTTAPTATIREGVTASTTAVGVLDVQSSTGSSLLFVSGSGFVGVGTNSPSSPVFPVTGGKFQVSSSNTGNAAFGLFIGSQFFGASLNYYDAYNHIFRHSDGSTIKVFLDGNGNVGIGSMSSIGVSNPLARLLVSGSSTSAASGLVVKAGIASPVGAVFEAQGNDGTSLLVVSGSGNVGIGISNTGDKLAVNGSLSVTGSALPGATSTYDLGSTAKLWRNVYSTAFSGSLTKLTDGTSAFIAGGNMSLITGSNGAITFATINSGTIHGVTAGTGLTGGGSSGTVTLGINDSVVATISGSTFTGAVKFNQGLSGSLTQLTNGASYLVAGLNVAITTGSNGQVTIDSSSPAGTVTGTGTTNFLTKWTGASTIGDSVISSIGAEIGVSGSILPGSDLTYDLGSPSKRWKTIYAANISGSLTGSNVLVGQVVVAGTGGVLSGSNLLFWDNTNGRLGIGTSTNTVARPLSVYSTQAATAIFKTANSVHTIVTIDNNDSLKESALELSNQGLAKWYIANTITNDFKLYDSVNAYDRILIKSGDIFLNPAVPGNVGIGVSSTTDRLAVNGSMSVTGSIIPGIDSLYDIGSSDKRWNNLYVNNISGSLTGSGIAAGSVVFATVGGLLSGSVSQLFWNTSANRLGIGTSTPGYKLEVNGDFAAVTKSFVIPHPTKQGWKLRHGSLEGPENGVYVRGCVTGSNIINLPDYWPALVDDSSITVQITPVGRWQQLYIESITSSKIVIKNSSWFARIFGIKPKFFYVAHALRKDAIFDVEFKNPDH